MKAADDNYKTVITWIKFDKVDYEKFHMYLDP